MAAASSTCTTACACDVCCGVQFTVDQIFGFLEIYGWILDAYVVDFFQEKLWHRIPKSWRDFFDEITPEELGKWILKESTSNRVWPLSLLALQKFVNISELSRDHRKPIEIKCSAKSLVASENKKDTLDDGKRKAVPGNKRFSNLFSKHVKKKKRYEIDVMSQITSKCGQEAECKGVVDIGAGMGHLARVLAYKYDMNVICVEQNQLLLEGARKWDEQLLASLKKHITDFDGRKPQHVSLQVGVSQSSRRQLSDQLTHMFNEKFDDSNEKYGYGIIGLHPCGDLAAALLKMYASEDDVRFICTVGCCYMKLTLRDSDEIRFPMSDFLGAKRNYPALSYAALEVACHAVEKHCEKLKSKDFGDLKVHAYRAVLEYLLIEKNPSLRHAQLKNTKIGENTTFEEYCKSATVNLEIRDRPTDLDYKRADIKNFLSKWKRVLIFVSLRMAIAPLAESIVLFDRYLYLSELNLSPALKAVFDPRISPRNILLTSIKRIN
ncbi:hypothetical protein QAD02_014657 [Eretmocerus hayati]|uniref:Uncharacterized protein n=1 Tax=Eretmocerus hayati TaxID=131215 RepID=A0ACC2PAT9_9HYME|nr:hypothetical protein QAD02_014657 [Eretmocerus hayati]